ncbi:hypothetical protein KR215_009800, partial [Drosophila sulfurigaster]
VKRREIALVLSVPVSNRIENQTTLFYNNLSSADPKCFPDRDVGHTKRSYCSRNANNVMWYYDSSSGSCKAFAYKGCGGNKNRFCSREDCVTECKKID